MENRPDPSAHITRAHFQQASFQPGVLQATTLPGPQSIPSVADADATYVHAPNAVALAEYNATLTNDHWVAELNRMRSAIDGRIQVEQKVIASTAVLTGSLSVGYVMWLLRGGLLLSSLLSSLPAWHVVDPLPVLARSKRDDDSDEVANDPLEKLFSRAKAVVAFGRNSTPHGDTTPASASGSKTALNFDTRRGAINAETIR